MTFTAKRIGIWAILLALAILVIAWFDGGQEPLHPIVQPVVVPGGS